MRSNPHNLSTRRVLCLILVAGGSCVPVAPACAQQAPTSLPDINVEASGPRDGSAAQGYKVQNADLGPLGRKKIEDTPYSIGVVSADLIQNVQVTSVANVLKYLPSAQMMEFGGAVGTGRPQTRGFQSSVTANIRIDGMNASNSALPMEEFERLEVLNGLSGSLYGAANPAGTFNFVQKRSTDTPLYQFITNYRSKGTGDAGVEASGAVLDTGLAYRITALYQDGEGFVTGSRFRRDLESLALDWHISENTVIETNLTHADANQRGFPGVFAYGQNAFGQSKVLIPKAPDPTKLGYGQSFAVADIETDTASLRVKHKFNQDWSVVIGGLYQLSSRWPLAITNTLTNNAGAYTSVLAVPQNTTLKTASNLAYLNGRVETFGLTHDLVLGTNGFQTQFFSPYVPPSIPLGSASIANPVVYSTPDVAYNKSIYNSSTPREQSLIFGDTITFNRYFQVMLTASEDWIHSTSFNNTGAVTASYNDAGLSPAASLIFKPVDFITTYATFAHSLQQGDLAPAGSANAGQGLKPYRSQQWEVGAKAKAFGLDVTADFFHITRPFANTDPTDNVFKIIGNQVNEGFEFMASGRFAENFSIFGGVTLINPKLMDTGRVATSNKDVVGVPKAQANVLLEYDVPAVRGLTLGTNIHYTGKRAADDANSVFIDGYTTVDIGLRFVTNVNSMKMTFRLGVNNVADKRYWTSVLPANITGSTSGTYQLTLGTPREFVAALRVNF
jgi:iron complex outermembrane receptor protein